MVQTAYFHRKTSIIRKLFTLKLNIRGKTRMFSIVRMGSNNSWQWLKWMLVYGSYIISTNIFLMGPMINQPFNTWKIIILVEFTNIIFQFKNLLAEGKLNRNNIHFSSCITCWHVVLQFGKKMNWTITFFHRGVEQNERFTFWYICFDVMIK